MKKILGILMALIAVFIFARPASAATTYNVADQPTFEAALAGATAGDTIVLDNSFSLSSEVHVNVDVTIDGNGYTLTPTFPKTTNSNNSALGIYAGATVEDLTVDGTLGTDLHGINTYEANGVTLNNVTLENNDHNGLVVNSSTVTVDNLTTSNNGWGGVDVDLGSGVAGPAVLTVNGVSNQNEAGGVDIYVDDTNKSVSVVDTNNQYYTSDSVYQSGDRVYTLIDPAPVVEITNPADGETVSGMVDVRGSATDNNPDHYYLVIKNSGGTVVDGPGTVNDNTSFTDKSLFSWNTTQVPDGEYTIWLAARDAAGNRDDSVSLDTVNVTVSNRTPYDMNQCKKGGWESYGLFKNQGDCVSYVATGGRNLPAVQ